MKKAFRFSIIFLVSTLLFLPTLSGQNKQKEEKQAYTFTIDKQIPATPVKDQHRSGTCWSYATTSFIESELIRTGKGEYDLSEMYFVRKAYELKAKKYVRLHGKINFAGGGLAMDVMHIWESEGVLPEEAYRGLTIGEDLPVHGEMDAVLKGYMDRVITNPNRGLTPVWKKGLDGILDAYLGEVPASFKVNGTSQTSRSYADGFDLDPKDYMAIGSYTHHPFYEKFIIEIPDNWIWGSIQNVTLDEMISVLDEALEKGYSVCWDADVGEKGYDWKSGVALIPSEEIGDLSGLERARWDELSEKEQQALFYDFSSIKKEKIITQEYRQKLFDNYRTTDDHLMHITGRAHDQDGKKFYLVKNSWGTANHIYEGYHYISEAYMRAKTIFFMVHLEALPAELAKKLQY